LDTTRLRSLTREQCNTLYTQVLRDADTAAIRKLCLTDLFFLLTVVCRRKDINRDWLFDRCREVEADPDDRLDLWAREHYKSTLITYGKTIQDILRNPEITVGIFSHTRPIAKAFLNQIKMELEGNSFLQDLFPEVLYKQPRKESPKWSLDSGIVVKRDSNPKEATVEANGLVDGQPTSKHYSLLVYDDVVTLESVTTPEQINKTTTAWEMSLNLGARGGAKRYIGTRYHYNDTYRTMLDREVAIPRIHKATVDGTVDGEPVFLTREQLAEKRKAFGPYVFSSQMLQDPVADQAMGFRQEWLRYYSQLRNHSRWNFYITVDPAGEKKKGSDYTVMTVQALAPDRNVYLVDAVRDRMNLTERTSKLFEFVRKYQPLAVGYEKYGLQADIEHIEYEMELQNYRFRIINLGGSMPKNDRIRRLVPLFEQGRYWLPVRCLFVDLEHRQRDFVHEFVNEEYLSFPVAVHDDMLDCLSRILDTDLGARFPAEEKHILTMTESTDETRVRTEYKLFP